MTCIIMVKNGYCTVLPQMEFLNRQNPSRQINNVRDLQFYMPRRYVKNNWKHTVSSNIKHIIRFE